jgi:hypothetical protein
MGINVLVSMMRLCTFLYGDDKLGAVGGLECVCHLYLFCVAGVVFGVEQSIDRVRAHDVRVGQCVFIVVGGKYGWWGVFAVHDCAECFCDSAYVMWFVE